MTLHLSYEIIFHVGGLKLAMIDIASPSLKVMEFFRDNRKILFYFMGLVSVLLSKFASNMTKTYVCLLTLKFIVFHQGKGNFMI